MLGGIFYLENRTVKCEELELTEEIKLGYGVTAGKKRKSNDKHTTVKFETRMIAMDISSLVGNRSYRILRPPLMGPCDFEHRLYKAQD